MKTSKLLVAAIATAMSAATAGAQQAIQYCNSGTGTGEAAYSASSTACAVTNTASATVNSVAKLDINTTATTLTAPKAADFGNAAVVTANGGATGAPTIVVSSNVNYTLTATATNWQKDGATYATKDVSDLEIGVNGAGAFAPLSNVAIATSQAKTAAANYALTYRTKYNWTTDVPGAYTLPITFTLTAP